MAIVIAIIITLVIDWGGGYAIKVYQDNKKKNRDDMLMFKVETILQDTSMKIEKRIEKCKELCRETEGDVSYGMYIILSTLEPVETETNFQ